MSLNVVTIAEQYIGGIELKVIDLPLEEKIRTYEAHTFVPRFFCTLEPSEAKKVTEYFSKRIEELRKYTAYEQER